MNVLVACEESQAVCIAFRNRGHRAFSCDIQECSGGHPEWHIQGDVLPLINGNCSFVTADTHTHTQVGPWDLLIAHPPCTFLTPAGAANIPKHPERIALGEEAARFFMLFVNADCERIAVENPPPMKAFNLPKYSQLVRPWQFGENNGKPVALWLKNLPRLNPSKIIDFKPEMVYWTHKATGKKKSCSKWYNTDTAHHSKHRSKTFQGIAAAMADQWGTDKPKLGQLNLFDDF